MASTQILVCPERCLGDHVKLRDYSFNGTAVANEHILADHRGEWLDTLETETVGWPSEFECSNCGRAATWIDDPDAKPRHPGRRYG